MMTHMMDNPVAAMMVLIGLVVVVVVGLVAVRVYGTRQRRPVAASTPASTPASTVVELPSVEE